ncbi:MAG: ABC transporter permease [Rhodocyclaceae bacterium]
MPFVPVVLWTDALIFVLVGASIAAAVYSLRQAHLRAAWRRVGESRAGMAALAVLTLFLAVGLLDSLHYRPRLANSGGQQQSAFGVEVLSVFDALAAGLRTRTEKTYSAPLATQAFAKETLERGDGTQTRDFPRLKHGGAHLGDPGQDQLADIAYRAFKGLALGAVAWLAIAMVLVAVQSRRSDQPLDRTWRSIVRGETRLAWNAVLWALAAAAVLLGPLLALSGSYHVFGTDKVGQDVLYLTLKSIRTALVIGTLTTLVTLPFAVALGLLAGYFGGWIDDVIQYLYTTLNSIPGVLLIAAAVLMMQVVIDTHPEWFATAAERADARLLALCLILGVTSWTGLCRLLRGEALKLRELDYVQAAEAFGVSHGRIIARHLLPNVMHIVLIALVMDFSGLVLAEAVLSYVGIGVDPTTISFGTMINTARMELSREPVVWWSLAAAFVFMFTLVLAANLFADAVRDAFDPRARPRPRRSLRAAT